MYDAENIGYQNLYPFGTSKCLPSCRYLKQLFIPEHLKILQSHLYFEVVEIWKQQKI